MLGRLFAPPETRGAYASMWLAGIDTSAATRAGVPVNQANAMTLNVVYAAVRIIADSIATLPMDTFIRLNGERKAYRPRPAWVDAPDPDPAVNRSDHYQQVLVSLMIAGNYYGRKLTDPQTGELLAITALDPLRVTPRRNPRGYVEFVVDGSTVLDSDQVVHITELRKPGAIKGTSRVDELKELLGISKALDTFAAAYFSSGTLTSGIVNVPGDMTEEQATTLKDQFEKNSRGLRNAHRPNVLSGGATYSKIGADAEQSQMQQSREFAVVEVARAFKIPPSKLGVNTAGTRAYASVEQDAIDFVTTTLRPYVFKIEEAYSRLLPDRAFLRFNMEGLLRGDIASRYNAYSIGSQAGFLSIDDIHRLEDMPAVPGGDVYRVPLTNVDLDASAVTVTTMQVQMVAQLVAAGYEPASALAMVGLPPVAHTGLPSVQVQAAPLIGATP